ATNYESIYVANSFTANGTTVVVTGDKRGRIRARSLSGDSVDAELVGHKGTVRGAAGVAHGADLYVVSTADDETVRVWKLKSARPRSKILTRDDGRGGPVACAVVDDRPIALVGHGDDIHVWDLRTRERVGDPLPHT